MVKVPNHPRAGKDGYVFEHILVVEIAIGKFLKTPAVVHHVNEIRNDNRSANLVVLENRRHHSEIHRKMRAFQACGNAEWLRCWICKTYDDPCNLSVRSSGNRIAEGRHRSCFAKYQSSSRLKL